MRAFVALSFLMVAALAKPQYNYNPGAIAIPQVPFASAPVSSYIPPATGGSGISTYPGNYGGLGQSSNPSPAVSTFPQVSGGGQGPVYHEPITQTHEAPLITKQFFVHSAPEDHDSVGKTKHFVLGRPQKNYRVVFIKAPSDSNANVHLSAEYAPQEEKTVIYVLSQKEHELDVNDIATPAPTQPSKPEVFFIKYKTPEEAAHAQREIQSQYNVLEGTNEVSDEGTAPLTSVVGVLDRPVDNHALNTLGNQYLPTHKA